MADPEQTAALGAANALVMEGDAGGTLSLIPQPDGYLCLQSSTPSEKHNNNLNLGAVIAMRDYMNWWLQNAR